MICVYEARRKGTADTYIGLTNNLRDRIKSHECSARKGSTTHFHRALRKYGDSTFEWQVLATLPTPEEAAIAEMLLIATKQPRYNMSAGGDGARGHTISEETRRKMSEASKKFRHTAESRAKIGAANRGKKVSEATRQKLREALQRRAQEGNPLCKARAEQRSAKLRAWNAARREAGLNKYQAKGLTTEELRTLSQRKEG